MVKRQTKAKMRRTARQAKAKSRGFIEDKINRSGNICINVMKPLE